MSAKGVIVLAAVALAIAIVVMANMGSTSAAVPRALACGSGYEVVTDGEVLVVSANCWTNIQQRPRRTDGDFVNDFKWDNTTGVVDIFVHFADGSAKEFLRHKPTERVEFDPRPGRSRIVTGFQLRNPDHPAVKEVKMKITAK